MVTILLLFHAQGDAEESSLVRYILVALGGLLPEIYSQAFLFGKKEVEQNTKSSLFTILLLNGTE